MGSFCWFLHDSYWNDFPKTLYKQSRMHWIVTGTYTILALIPFVLSKYLKDSSRRRNPHVPPARQHYG